MRHPDGRQVTKLESAKQEEPESRKKAPPYKLFQDFQASYSTLDQARYKAVDAVVSPNLGSERGPDRHQHLIHMPSRKG